MPRSANDAKLNGATASPSSEAVAPANEPNPDEAYSPDGLEPPDGSESPGGPDGPETSDDGTDHDDRPEAAAAQGRRRFGTLWLAAAVVVGLLLGYAGGLLTPSLRTPGDASAEAGFLRDMYLHHGQAVEIALIEYQRGSVDPEVHNLAYDIAVGQENERGYMRRLLEEWHLSPNSTQPKMAWMPEGTAALQNGLMPGMATDDEILKMRQAPEGRAVDILFAQYMLRHHLGGIHMIDGVLKQSSQPEIVKLGTTMKAVQQREVGILQGMLKDFDAQPR